MSRALPLLLALCLLARAGDPPAVEWNKDTVTPVCPSCTAEVPLEATKCPGCGAAVTWKDLVFDDTPAGAFVKFKYSLKYRRPDLLETCVSDELYDLAEGDNFQVRKGPLSAFLKARLKKVERKDDSATIAFETGEGEARREFAFVATREGGTWRIGPPAGAAGSEVARNEALTRRDLALIVEAERAWRDQDLGHVGRREYWTLDVAGLFAHKDEKGRRAEAIRQGLARADGADVAARYPDLGRPRATHGYRFRMLPAEKGGFAVCARPERYAETGRKTFLVNEDGAVFEKDLGAATQGASGVEAWPEDPAGEGWKKSSGEGELGR